MTDFFSTLVSNWREDKGATYQSWFLWQERLKNFRSIRTGLRAVVEEIEAGDFGTSYRGSSLETVVHSIAEQRQIFKGADHAFLWKPKLRIPDIYESNANQRAFGRLIDSCICCNSEKEVVDAIYAIDQLRIKGLGPAVANLLYFLHPTFMPPFNTAIVTGYNDFTGSKTKLGRWDEYLAMRTGLLKLNHQYRDLLSNDLGAISGLMFDIGKKRYPLPPRTDDSNAAIRWEEDLANIRQEGALRAKAEIQAQEVDLTHTEIQGWLRDMGLALGYQVWIASNDRSRNFEDGKLGKGCLEELPKALAQANGVDAVKLIDVIWFEASNEHAIAAFEVEHSTSIYSGIVRMLDLVRGGGAPTLDSVFLVAPDDRENEVRAQIARPAFSSIADLKVRYIPYGELAKNRESAARFGSGMKAVHALSRALT